MASKPKRATITNSKKKPVTPPKAAKLAKPRRKRQPQRAWWDVLLDFIGNFILLMLASALILDLAHFFRDFFDWLL